MGDVDLSPGARRRHVPGNSELRVEHGRSDQVLLAPRNVRHAADRDDLRVARILRRIVVQRTADLNPVGSIEPHDEDL